MYCSNCGKLVEDNTKYCENCGKKIFVENTDYEEIKEKIIIPDGKNKTSAGTWSTLIVVYIIVFLSVYGLFGGEDFFRSKSSKCKTEAGEEAESLRKKEIILLKQKINPTAQDLAKIEKLENALKQNLVSRDDFDYLYNLCMDR